MVGSSSGTIKPVASVNFVLVISLTRDSELIPRRSIGNNFTFISLYAKRYIKILVRKMNVIHVRNTRTILTIVKKQREQQKQRSRNRGPRDRRFHLEMERRTVNVWPM